MQAQYSHERAYYRCGYAREYTLANHVKHPLNVYVRESDVLPALDEWLLKLFAPHHIDDTIRQLTNHQDAPEKITTPVEPDEDTAALIAQCDEKPSKYRAALEAGVDPETVGQWINTVKAERAAITARASAAHTTAQPDRKLSQEETGNIVRALTDIRTVIQHADPADKARVYEALGLHLTYDPVKHSVRAQVTLDPDMRGVMVRVRVAINTLTQLTLCPIATILALSMSGAQQNSVIVGR